MKLISVAGIILLTHYGVCQNVDGDYIVVENDVEDDYEDSGSGSGDGDDFCELGSGDEEEDLSGIAETVPYSMASSNNLDIELSLLHMVDDSVKIDCDVKKIYQEVSSSDAFPANLYLIKDVAVCNDLATAVGNDITADVVDLGIVSGYTMSHFQQEIHLGVTTSKSNLISKIADSDNPKTMNKQGDEHCFSMTDLQQIDSWCICNHASMKRK